MSDARITIGADLSDFRHDFALANQFAEQRVKEFRANARGHFDGFVSDAGTLAKSAAGHVGANAEKMSNAVERAASLMGGAFGDVADITLDLGGKMGSLVGPIGVATAAVAGLGYAAVQLAGYADDAARRLEAAGLAAMIPRGAQDSLDRYRDGTAALRTESDLLAVTFGGPLLSSIGDLSLALVGLETTASKVLSPLSSVADRVGEALGSTGVRVLTAIGTAGGSEFARALSGRIEDAIATGEQVAEVQQQASEGAKATEALLQRSLKAAEDVATAREREATSTARTTAATRAYVPAQAAVVEGLSGELDLRRQLQVARAEDERQIAALAEQQARADEIGALASAQSANAAASLPALDAAAGQLGSKIALSAAEGILPILSGGAGGVMGAVGAAGPIGAAIAAIVLLPDLITGVSDTVDELTNLFTDLPDKMREALTETLPDLFSDGIPELVGALAGVGPQLTVAVMDAIPEIVSAQVEMIPKLVGELIRGLGENLPALLGAALELAVSQLLTGGPFTLAIAEGVWQGMGGILDMLPDKIADAIRDLLGGIAKPFTDDKGRFLGTDLNAEGGRSLFGIDLPSFARGTSEVTRTGVAVVHRGEEIRRSGMERGGPAAAPVIHVHGGDTREIVRQIRELLGGDYGPSYGTGDSL